jgi:hypothetical protein
MKRDRKASRRRRNSIQAYTHAQALRVLPYVGSIMRSLREWRLEAQHFDRNVRRIADRPGRPDRSTLLDMEEANRCRRSADERFDEALNDLHTLDVYCLDPLRGEALIPFVHDDQLAWYVYDLFDDEPLREWRYHTDPLDKRRPRSEAEQKSDDDSVVV